MAYDGPDERLQGARLHGDPPTRCTTGTYDDPGCDTRLQYSFATCGYGDHDYLVGQWNARTSEARGKGLRAGIPGDETFMLVTLGDGETGIRGSGRDGAVLSFAARVLDAYSVPWHVVPISESSRSLYPQSSYTACVHDIFTPNDSSENLN